MLFAGREPEILKGGSSKKKKNKEKITRLWKKDAHAYPDFRCSYMGMRLTRKSAACSRDSELAITSFWISTIIQLHNNSNGRKQMEGGRLPCTWCACNWEYNLQLWAQRITQCVASNSWNSRRASQLPSNIRRLKIEVYHLLVAERTRPTVLPNSHQAHLLKYMTNWGTFSSS